MRALIVRWSEAILNTSLNADITINAAQDMESDDMSLSGDCDQDHEHSGNVDEAEESVQCLDDGDDDGDSREIQQPPIATLNLRLSQQRAVASKRVSLESSRAESHRACTQSQESETYHEEIASDANALIRQLSRRNRHNSANESNSGTDSSIEEAIPISHRRRKRKRKFSNIEKQAIREGIERFGEGNWKEIKDYEDSHQDRLGLRNNVQIKDQYRTMKNKGEV
jgi:hypothetical protein